MSEQTPFYMIDKAQRLTTYQLTPAEKKVVDWMRRGASNGRDWMGTIRFSSGPNIWQMSDHVKAGQVKNAP